MSEYEGLPKRRRRNVRYQSDNEVEDASFHAFHNASAFNRSADADDDELARMIKARLQQPKAR